MKAAQLLEVFQAGKSVANPEAWKKGTININTLLVLISGLLSILHFFDCSFCNFDLTSEQQLNIALGIMTISGVFNVGSTAATSDKIGLIKSKELEQEIKDLQ